MLNTRFYNSILAVSIAAALAACGGGGGSSSDGVKPVTEKNGRAVDGPLAGSLVVFEDCQNQTTQTDAQGYFKFPLGCSSSSIRISGGLDTATNLAFSSTLKAPKSSSNDVIVSPITTLIQTQVEAGKTVTEANAEIARALGLQGTNLLTADPMDSQELYTKTVVVQQLVEQIKSSIAPLGASLSEEAFTAATFAALSQALTADTSISSLQDPAIIQATISQTLTAIEDNLAPEYQGKLDEVSANLAALATPAIIANVQSVQETLESLPSDTFSAGVDAIQQSTAADLQTAKESIVTHKLVSTLSEALTLPAEEASSILANVGNAAASSSQENLTDALIQLAEIDSSINVEALEESLMAEFYADYIKLASFSILNTSYTYQQFNDSLRSPIDLSELNGLLLGVESYGKLTNQALEFSAGLSLNTLSNKQVTISIDRLNLAFNTTGGLQAARLPSGAKLNLSSTLNSVPNADITLGTSIDVLENGKVALNGDVLAQIAPQFANLAKLPLKGETVLLTAVLQPKNNEYIAHNNAQQKPVLSSKYQIDAQSFGSGVSAKFNIAP